MGARLRIQRGLQVDLVREPVAVVEQVQALRNDRVALELDRADLARALDEVLHALVDRALVQDDAQAVEDPARTPLLSGLPLPEMLAFGRMVCAAPSLQNKASPRP